MILCASGATLFQTISSIKRARAFMSISKQLDTLHRVSVGFGIGDGDGPVAKFDLVIRVAKHFSALAVRRHDIGVGRIQLCFPLGKGQIRHARTSKHAFRLSILKEKPPKKAGEILARLTTLLDVIPGR